MGQLIVLSDEEREDIVNLWMAGFNKYWPECELDLIVLDGSAKNGWTQRLLEHLEKTMPRWALLWLDDFVLTRSVASSRFSEVLLFFLKHPDIAGAHLMPTSPHGRTLVGKVEGLPGFRYFGDMQPHYDRVCNSPCLWRGDVLINMCNAALDHYVIPAQDAGWVGAYNFELASWRGIGVGDEVIGPESERLLQYYHASVQSRWREGVEKIAADLGHDLDLTRGFFKEGQSSPHVDLWREVGNAAALERRLKRAQEQVTEAENET